MAQKSQSALIDEIAEAKRQIKSGARYAHYKNPANHYIVTGFVIIESTDEIGVVYQADYGEKLSFVRPVKVWLEKVDWQGKSVPRFTEVA